MKNGQNGHLFTWKGKEDEGDELFDDTWYDSNRKNLYGNFVLHFCTMPEVSPQMIKQNCQLNS